LLGEERKRFTCDYSLKLVFFKSRILMVYGIDMPNPNVNHISNVNRKDDNKNNRRIEIKELVS